MEPQELTLTDDQARGLRVLVETLQEDDSWKGKMEEVIGDPSRELGEDWTGSVRQRIRHLAEAAERGDLTGYLEEQRARFQEMASAGMSLRTITQALTEIREPMAEILRSHLTERDDQIGAVDMLDRLLMESLVSAGEVYAAQRQDDVEDEYRQIVRRLSTPVIEVWDGIQVLPLIGVLDSTRAQQMTEQLLERLVDRQARMVIIDITGVPTVDTAVADHLLKTIRAAALVGTRAILVGISPQVAQTLVRLGLSLEGVETFADLRSGLERALESLGYRVDGKGL
ncbi:MAG: STAS domain-containing protein [Actinomycetota bacterium]